MKSQKTTLLIIIFTLLITLPSVNADVGDTGYFGEKGAGSAVATTTDGFYGTVFYLPVRANITGLAAYYKVNSGDHPGRAAIYSVDGQTCYYGTLDDEGTVESYIWHNWTSTNFVTLDAGYYILGVRLSTGGQYYNSTTTGNGVFYAVAAEVDANGPMSLTYTNYRWNIYANYTETAEVLTAGSESSNYTYVAVMFFMIIADIFFAGSKKAPILGFIFGIISICIVAVAAGYGSYIVFYPLPNVLLGFVAIVTLFSAGLSLRGS